MKIQQTGGIALVSDQRGRITRAWSMECTWTVWWEPVGPFKKETITLRRNMNKNCIIISL
ncbi:MAG: hypothetical protein M1119_07675 [Firmicutes bacterium]|nr:hypothetical protein [Bacillota bacterium]